MTNTQKTIIGGSPPKGRYKFDIDQDFYQKVSSGLVPGWQRFGFAGHNPSASLGVEETIWYPGGRRILLTEPKNLYLSSTNAGDTSTVEIVVLDDQKRFTIRLATLNGQNQVLIGGGALWRILIHSANGSGQADGAIYIAEQDTLTGGVPDHPEKIQSASAPGRRLSWNGFFTVPSGYIGRLMLVRITPTKDKVANIYFNSIFDGESGWASATPFESGQNFEFIPPANLDEDIDIEFSVISEDDQIKTTCVVDIILINDWAI